MPHAPSPGEKILVTGGAGFIGLHLLSALCASGLRPIGTTRKLKQLDALPAGAGEQIRWRELDVTDREAVQRLIEAERPAIIFHLAGTRGKGDAEQAKQDCAELNVRATAHLLEAAQATGVRRIIITGSADEYGKQVGPLKESFALQPVSAYGNSKAEATRLARRMFEQDACPVVILRPFTVYGPRQPHPMFVREATRSAVNGLPFSMSEGRQKRDLIFVDDVVRALIASAIVPRLEGKVINLGSGEAISLRDVARLIWRLSESRAPLLIGARPASDSDMYDTWADITLAGELLDWQPCVSLEKGLRAMIEWQLEQKLLTTGEREKDSGVLLSNLE